MTTFTDNLHVIASVLLLVTAVWFVNVRTEYANTVRKPPPMKVASFELSVAQDEFDRLHARIMGIKLPTKGNK